jgi:hypothetical protein
MGGDVVVVVEDVVDVGAAVDAGSDGETVDGETGFVSAEAPSESDPEQLAATIRAAHSRIPRRPPVRETVRPQSNVFLAGSRGSMTRETIPVWRSCPLGDHARLEIMPGS